MCLITNEVFGLPSHLMKNHLPIRVDFWLRPFGIFRSPNFRM